MYQVLQKAGGPPSCPSDPLANSVGARVSQPSSAGWAVSIASAKAASHAALPVVDRVHNSLLQRRTGDERQHGRDTQADSEREYLVQSENELVAFPLLDIVGEPFPCRY
jgi:hypothetical protein